MKLDRKDTAAVGLAILIAGTLLTTWAGWGVPLIGDSHRWATVAVIVLGLAAGTFSSPGTDSGSYVLAGLVLAAFLFAVIALATGSLAPLVLLVAAVLALIIDSTGRHVRHGRGRTVATGQR